jgi:hypothetical protein
MRRIVCALLVGALASACGTKPDERTESGAAVGAGTGAAIGALAFGIGAIPGALIGAALGAGTGANTTPEQVDLGDPAWKDRKPAEAKPTDAAAAQTPPSTPTARAESAPPPEWVELPEPPAPVATTRPVVALAPPQQIAPLVETRRKPVSAPSAVDARDTARPDAPPPQPVAPVAAAPPAPVEAQPGGLDRDDLRVVQETLQSQGFYRGPLDGVFGAATQDAVARYQRRHGLRETAKLDAATLARLDADQASSYGAAGAPAKPAGSDAPNARR